MNPEIKLLQFLICKEFRQEKQDTYAAELIRSNLYAPKFPYHFHQLFAVTCWQKDRRFHKEVIEYTTDYGASVRTPHMDIEPVRDSVLFRWHTHRFPSNFVIEKPTLLQIQVILDAKVCFESRLMIEKAP